MIGGDAGLHIHSEVNTTCLLGDFTRRGKKIDSKEKKKEEATASGERHMRILRHVCLSTASSRKVEVNLNGHSRCHLEHRAASCPPDLRFDVTLVKLCIEAGCCPIIMPVFHRAPERSSVYW